MNSDTPRTDNEINRHSLLLPTTRLANLCRTLERENNQLRADLKQCAECLQTAIYIIKSEYGSNNWRLVDFKKALSLPSVQNALKGHDAKA